MSIVSVMVSIVTLAPAVSRIMFELFSEQVNHYEFLLTTNRKILICVFVTVLNFLKIKLFNRYWFTEIKTSISFSLIDKIAA